METSCKPVQVFYHVEIVLFSRQNLEHLTGLPTPLIGENYCETACPAHLACLKNFPLCIDV